MRSGWFRTEKVKTEKGESEIPATIWIGGGGGSLSGNARVRRSGQRQGIRQPKRTIDPLAIVCQVTTAG